MIEAPNSFLRPLRAVAMILLLALQALPLSCGVVSTKDSPAPATRPNILIIVADDVGWADVGFHGSPIPTPHLDRLAASAVILERHYVAPLCTPTRAALLTGRYWSRFGNDAPSNEQVLPFGTVTLASALRDAGYATCITGKWHLGSLPEWGPRKFGFARSHGSLAGGVHPISHLYKHGPYSKTWHRDDVLIEEEGHVTDLISREAVRYIEAKHDGPFFVYVPFTAAHTPFDEPAELLEACAAIPQERRQYAASVAHLDRAVGEMVAALSRTGQLDDTLVLFFSDNGGTNTSDSPRYPDTVRKGSVFGLNTPLRGWKREVYEGGIRTPAFVAWPSRFAPARVEAPLHVSDWMPTLTGIAGCELEGDLLFDGVDIAPILRGDSKGDEERLLYTRGPSGFSAALHCGRWKLVRDYRASTTELYDLREDPSETTDLAARRPDRVRELLAALERVAAADDSARPEKP